MKLLKSLVLAIFVSQAVFFAGEFSIEKSELEIAKRKNTSTVLLFFVGDICHSLNDAGLHTAILGVWREADRLFCFSWAKDDSKYSCWDITYLSTEVKKFAFSYVLTDISPMIKKSKCAGLIANESMNNSHRNLGSGNLFKLGAEASTASAITTVNQIEVPVPKLSIILPTEYPIEESRSRGNSWDACDWDFKSLPGSPIAVY